MYTEKSKILVVDDEPDIVAVLKDFLSLKGYDVIDAYSGQEALDVLSKEKADLVLLDVAMPGLKGTEAAKIIRERFPSVKIVLLTGYPGDIAKDLQDGNVLEAIFTKPVRMQELLSKVVCILDRKDAAPAPDAEQKIKARILLIKARLLLIEPSLEAYNLLEAHFKQLSRKGEHYLLDVACNEEQIMEKLKSFEPDIIVANASFFKEDEKNIISNMLDKNLSSREILIYNIDSANGFNAERLEKLTKNVEAACFTRGFIEFGDIYI